MAWMGEQAGDRPRQEARDAMPQVRDAGLDFVSLGLGSEWDEVLLNEMNTLGSGKGTWYIDSARAAEEAFASVAQQQRDSVIPAVTLEGTLNTEHFHWHVVRPLLPQATGAAPITPAGRAEMEGYQAVQWRQNLGNPVGDQPYCYVLEAEPLRSNRPGTYPIGRFRLRARGIDFPDVMEPRLNVIERGRVAEPTWSTPQNPLQGVWHVYQQSRIPDIQKALSTCLARGDRAGVVRYWREIIAIYEKAGENVVAQRERDALAAWAAQGNLSPQEVQKQGITRLTTATAPVTASRVGSSLDRSKNAIHGELTDQGYRRLDRTALGGGTKPLVQQIRRGTKK